MRLGLAGRHMAPWVLAGALLAGRPALAQEKIAPSRTYGATYVPTLKEHPDRNFGLPTFGRKDSGMPEQRGLNADAEPPARPGQPKPEEGPLPERASAAALPAPRSRPGSDVVPSSSSQPDFFAPDTDFDLPKPGSHDSTDTPLFTTQDGAGARDRTDSGD